MDLLGFASNIIKDFGAGYVPSILDVKLLDEVVKVKIVCPSIFHFLSYPNVEEYHWNSLDILFCAKLVL